jgi:hypothetical protein
MSYSMNDDTLMRIDAAIARRDRAIQVAMDQYDQQIRIIIENNIETVPIIAPPPVPDIQLPLTNIQLQDALDKIPVGSLMAKPSR